MDIASLADTRPEAPARAAGARLAPILVDETHCGRHVTGLERITLELFSREALAPLPVSPIRASGRAAMMLRQTFGLPFAAWTRGALTLCPGFPPSALFSLAGGRVLPYIHDLFLITRRADLNPRARLLMAPPFRLAVARLPRFLVNSEYTRDELRRFCRADAEVHLYRPRVRNVFGLSHGERAARPAPGRAPRLVALGTIEPRKNLLAAAGIVAALRAQGASEARLDVVGRPGWGEDAKMLAASPGVVLHGYQPVERAREIVEAADALISTSHDEGLGLPLIEAQYAGLRTIAPDGRVFREALGESGLHVDPSRPEESAAAILADFSTPDWRARTLGAAVGNIARWNALADADRPRVIELIARLASEKIR